MPTVITYNHLRQYSKVKGERGKAFTYNDIQKVYTIVIFENSTKVFHSIPEHYIHKGKTIFDTGLELELLQEYCLIALDVFRKKTYPKIRSEQTAWISFLASETVEEAKTLTEEYPWLKEIYEEMAEYMHKPKEVLDMFSEALRILDRNTVQYMIEEQQEELAKAKQQLEELAKVKQQLEEKDAEIARLQELLGRKKQ